MTFGAFRETIHGEHWSEQRYCSHPETRLMCYQMSNGVEQVCTACVACGYRPEKLWLAHRDHPERKSYPLLIPHPDPCSCHLNVGALRHGGELAYHDYINSEEWRQRAKYFKSRALFRCQICGLRRPDGRGLDAHHNNYSRLGAELDLDIIVLCRDCHARHHDKLGAEAA